jgi:hypothetical protein
MAARTPIYTHAAHGGGAAAAAAASGSPAGGAGRPARILAHVERADRSERLRAAAGAGARRRCVQTPGRRPPPPPSPPPAAPPAAPANRCLLLPDAAGGFLGQAHAIVQPQDAMLAAAAPQQASPLGRTHARGGGGTLVLCLLTHSPCLQVWVVPGAVAVVWACLMTVLGALLGGAVAGFGSVCRAGRPPGQCRCACGALGWMETGLNAQL